ncbi:MAG: phospholipase D-like domain-containing protein [Usitatibacter sp.]
MNFALRSCAALALLILAACNTLPTVDSGGVSRGPLYLEDLDTPLKAGNRVVLLQNGAATYGAMLQAIAGARDSINMESYIFEDDEVGTKFADALVAKQAQGVQVTLIYDSVGSNGSSAQFFKRLTDSGIQVLEFNPINPLAAKGLTYKIGNRDHRKLLIVDGRTAFMGGINISGVYTSGSGSGSGAGSGAPRSNATRQPMPWRDTHLQVQGPVVADFQRLFMATWEKQKGPPMAARDFFPSTAAVGGEVVRAIGSSPDDPYSLFYATLVSAIDNAKTSVHLTNAYFVPDPQLLAALVGAARRGVDVALVLPSNSDNWLVLYAGRSHYEKLLENGVRIYERRGALLHAKTGIIDGRWSTIGSTNLDRISFLHNQEINAVVMGADFGAQMEAMFDADIAVSDHITLETWEKRPIADHFREIASRAWAYWL